MREKNPRSVIDQKHTEQIKRLEATRENHMAHNKGNPSQQLLILTGKCGRQQSLKQGISSPKTTMDNLNYFTHQSHLLQLKMKRTLSTILTA